MRTEPTAVSTFDAKTVRRRLEGTLAEKFAALARERAAAGRRRTKALMLIVALIAVNIINVSSTMPSAPKLAMAIAILLIVLSAAAVAIGKLWAERVLNVRPQGHRQGTRQGLSEAEIDAWLASLPAITPIGKERLATLLAMNAIDLDVISGWIDREVERLEIADEERRLGLRSVTADLRLAKVATIRGENEVAHLEASS